MPWEKSFDVDEALQRAMGAFWADGYEATSMTSLLEAMGIQKGSFYDTFGSKREALLEALRMYADDRHGALGRLREGRTARQAIETMFERAARGEPDKACGAKGCFAANCAVELAARDEEVAKLVRASLKRNTDALRLLIEEAQGAGDADASIDAQQTARAMLGALLGMQVMARAGVDRSTLSSVAAGALRLLG